VTAPPATQRSRLKTSAIDTVTAVAFLTPAMIGFLIFVIIPAIAGLALAFFDWDLFGVPEWVGADNFIRLFADPAVWQALVVTLLFVVLGVIPTVGGGFVLAVLINTRLRGVAAFRVVFFAPMIASAAVSSIIWVNLYHPTFGLINQALGWIGISGPNWLSDLTWALPALVIMLIWGSLPLVIILYLAGLQRVPEDIYAAASIDGASKWRQVWSMTWPNVWPTTLIVTVLLCVAFVSGSFETALIMTEGGPLGVTQTLALYSYKTAFVQRDIGYGSAIALFQLLLLAAIVVAGRALTYRKGRA
jgi:multiple sugar transport system permease protein